MFTYLRISVQCRGVRVLRLKRDQVRNVASREMFIYLFFRKKRAGVKKFLESICLLTLEKEN